MKGLLIIDPQIDFITGTLPVPGAVEAMDGLADWLMQKQHKYSARFVTMDFHPANHSSFADSGGQWPRHCVQWSAGAAIWPALLDALHATEGNLHFLQKGNQSSREEYSIFQNPESRRRLDSLIREESIDRLDICGLAGDICVLNTLKDGIGLYGAGMFNVLTGFSPSLDGGKTLAEFMENF